MPTTTLDRPVQGGVPLDVNGFKYGDPDWLAKAKQVSVPNDLNALVVSLCEQSKLLALPATALPQDIHAAYGADLSLLMRTRSAFKTTLEAAVHARADESHIDAQAFLSGLVAQVGDIEHQPKLDLGADVMKLEPPARLARLQQDFRDDVEELKESLVIWLNALTEADIISAVEWLDTGRTAVKYHFFWLASNRQNLGEKTHDPGMNLVGRHVTTTTETRVNIVGERRTHTVVDAQAFPLGEYTRAVPKRIASFIDQIPWEVRPFVTIIDGNLVKEEVARTTDLSRTERTERNVWVRDPTPTLFGLWALSGWGGSTPESVSSLYQGHAIQRANKALLIELTVLVVAIALAVFKGGGRLAAMIAIGGIIVIAAHQLSMRVEASRNPQAA
jgi:hypothetical protein